jgi:hypothetical protein
MTQQAPEALDWILCALERRAHDLSVLGACDSPGCMCAPGYIGDHHSADCRCYNRRHAMIELAKINSRFVNDVKEALRCSGSDSSVVS